MSEENQDASIPERKLFKVAKRKNLKLKMLIGGPSGSGKTYSALQLAQGFLGKLDNVGVLDTEDSAEIYDRFGPYTVLPFEKPFDPRRLEKVIDLAIDEGIELLVIDSITKFWEGEGGCLDIHDKFGGRFQDWAKTNKIWDSMLQKIVHSKIHIIATVRKKSDHEIVEKNGKKTVQKMGMKNMIRDGHEYEYSCALDLNIDHIASVSKDRTSIFEGICPVILTPEHGELLRDWCEGKA